MQVALPLALVRLFAILRWHVARCSLRIRIMSFHIRASNKTGTGGKEDRRGRIAGRGTGYRVNSCLKARAILYGVMPVIVANAAACSTFTSPRK